MTGDNREALLVTKGWPPALAKASVDDDFEYVLALRGGLVIYFRGAQEHADSLEWVTLFSPRFLTGRPITREETDYAATFERGLEVRVSEIQWAADAPWGS